MRPDEGKAVGVCHFDSMEAFVPASVEVHESVFLDQRPKVVLWPAFLTSRFFYLKIGKEGSDIQVYHLKYHAGNFPTTTNPALHKRSGRKVR